MLGSKKYATCLSYNVNDTIYEPIETYKKMN